ncbi:MAG TPA: tetratricopeptide repeat protein [Streptosporangiaceae bacterium]|nr:tetratricopeptide repeat protein [Streptosporangiaceae bacterium]
MQQPRDFSLYGAVDLGARQAALKRRDAAAQGPKPGTGHGGGQGGDASDGAAGAVIDVTEETFSTDVLERSLSVPVVIDLWAEWCGPCKQLSPVLEKLAAEAGGRWILAKIDTEANPQLSAALRVESIPMVMVAIGGQIVPGFLGAMPEAQVRQWIDQVMAEAQRLGFGGGSGGPPGSGHDGTAHPGSATARGGPGRPDGQNGAENLPSDPELAAAQKAMERGDLDGAEAAFEQMQASSPGNPVAALGLSQIRLVKRVNSYDQARVRKAAAEHPGDVEAQIRVADVDMAMGRTEDAFDRLIGTIRRTTGADRDHARRHLLSLFEVLPPRDPRVAKARTTLSGLLF